MVFLCLIHSSNALDVSFIPNDENEPLPLSKKYRDSLRKLCALLKTDISRLPVEIIQKRTTLEKVCHKLEKDDSNIDAASVSKSIKPQQLLYGLIGLGSGYYLWANRKWLTKKFINKPQRGNVLGYNNIVASSDVASSDVASIMNETPLVGTDSMEYAPSGNLVAVDLPVINVDRVAEARSARLKRFADMNSVNIVSAE